jgi:hypothetical protein
MTNMTTDKSDIAERLRDWVRCGTDDPTQLCAEAADELARLRKKNDELGDLIEVLIYNDPNDRMPADSGTVLDRWRKLASAALTQDKRDG